MKEPSNPNTDNRIKRLRLFTMGVVLLLAGAMIGGAAIAVSTINQLDRIQSGWVDFRQVTGNKGEALSQIRQYFGFGGFIHNFQNFISRHDPDLGGVVERDIEELLAAVATYELVGVNDAEAAALADLRHVIARYRENLVQATRLIRQGADTALIDRLSVVDTKPALAAMATLEVNWLEKLDAHTKKLMAGVSTGEWLIKTTFVFLPVLMLALIMLLWFMQRLVRVMVETVRAEHDLRTSEERNRLFVADVAHELRMPLAVMRLHLEKLDDQDTAQSLLEDVEKISRMLEQLLAAAKIESSTDQVPEFVDLHEVCVKVGAEVAPLAIREGRTVEVRGPDQPVRIRANGFALEQAVRNLVENSIKYAARETKIVIDVTNTPSIMVTDRGPGIPREMREAVFDPFLRSDRRGGGAGLGLSIVRRAAEVHDATIDIGDAPGGGSVFTITFPQDRARPAP